MLNKIEALNKNIDRLMKEKAKADAQKEVWEKRLVESINEYKEKYGVDLSDKSFKNIKAKLEKEINKVEAQTKEEYEMAQKIVGLIEEGDIDGAWKALGVDRSSSTVEEEPEVVVEEAPKAVQNGLQSASAAVKDVELDDFDESDLFGSVDDEEDDESATVELVEEKPVKNSFMLDDDDDDEGFVFSKPTPAKSIVLDDDDEDEFVVPSTSKSKEIILDDDEDEDDSYSGGFGGFGSILEGSKFDTRNK